MSAPPEQKSPLPRSRVCVSVKALNVGDMYIPDSWAFEDAKGSPDSTGSRLPDFAFLITHPTKGRAMFDLGLRKDGVYPPAMLKTIGIVQPRCENDAADILQSGGIEPDEIDFVIYSHLHWDHVGDPTPFTSAEIVMGADAVSLLGANAYPTNPKSAYQALPAARRVAYLHFQNEHAHLAITPFGPFERAVDFYGDGSLYLVDAPGHLPGHLIAAARIAPDGFVFLAGDTCHGRACYAGQSLRVVSDRVHKDPSAARSTADCLARLDREYENAIVILAHEKEREAEMPLFPKELNEWAVGEIAKRSVVV